MPSARRPVRPVDDVWLQMDQPDNLMVVEGLMVLDGELGRDAYVELLRERVLDLFPRMAQRARHLWLPWPGQWWEDDRAFDLDSHVDEVWLPPPGDDAALEDLVASSLSRALDRQRPPWEVHVVQGYDGGAVIHTRLHHALADGTALLRLVLALADEELTGERVDVEPAASRVVRSALGVLPAARRLVTAPLVAQHLLLARRPASPLSATPQHAKRAVWAPSIDLSGLQGVRRATGTTVTDIVMSALTGSLRRWLLAHGADPRDLPTMVPVDLRGSAALLPEELGNQFALVLLDLPVGVDSVLGRLTETAARMSAIKGSSEPWLTFGLLEGMGLLHPRLRVHTTDFFARKATGVTTSVRGPDEPLHLAGLPISRLWAWAPMSAGQTLSTSIVGYAGGLHVGFKVDATAVPDPHTLVTGLQDELEALRSLGA